MKNKRSLVLLGLTFIVASGLYGVPAAIAQPVVLTPAMQKSLNIALAQAVMENDVRLVEAVLDRGAEANMLLPAHKASGTVLHAAAADGRTDLVKCLLDHGADSIQRNTHFETARDLAVKGGHAAIAEMLRQAEKGTYKPSAVRKPEPIPVTPVAAAQTIKPATPKAVAAKQLAMLKAGRSRAQTKSRVARKSRNNKSSHAQARAYRKLKDYNYVKQNFGLGGSTYRSFKW